MKATKSQILRGKLKEILGLVKGQVGVTFKVKMLIQDTYFEEHKLSKRKKHASIKTKDL